MVRSRKCAAAENPLLLEGILHNVFNFITHPRDRDNISRVCKAWLAADRDTRRHVYIAFTYAVSPGTLIRRFKNLSSLKLKSKPRAYEFNLLPENWGGAVGPWVKPIVKAYPSLSALHLRRMEVTDEDLKDLATGFRASLECLKLDFCSGFSSMGLLAITRHCRNLKVLYLENSNIRDHGVEWLRELALHNKCLEELDFQVVDFNDPQDNSAVVDYLKDIICNCRNLRSLKFSDAEGDSLRDVLSKSKSLRQLGIILNSEEEAAGPGGGTRLELPVNLTSISGDIPVPLLSPVAWRLVKLDLMTSFKSTTEEHHELIKSCPNLQNLQVRTILGDQGLRIVAQSCKKLQKIRVEEQGDEVFVSQAGLVSLVQGCNMLQKLTIYVSDISNAALETVGKCCPELVDFRLVLTDAGGADVTSQLPIDDGYLAIMKGCTMLSRMCIYVRRGALSDRGMALIGSHGSRLKALLLGGIGETEAGFKALAKGCTSLERLEMRDCCFTDEALVAGVKYMKNLKLLWVQGYIDRDHRRLLELENGRDGWHVEYNPGSANVTVTFLMYRSLVPGRRVDCPDDVISPRNGACRW